MSLGRVTESTFRSINNILEHLHQSFFFYILMGKLRFVSIGSYLPAAMILAGSFTINALALWVLSGRGPVEKPGKTTPGTSEKLKEKVAVSVGDGENDVVVVPKAELDSVERKLALPAITILAVHLLSFIPLYLLTSLHQKVRPTTSSIYLNDRVTNCMIHSTTSGPSTPSQQQPTSSP
jgi:glycosylphosphatidylinositol transamidase